jgi:cytochrome P450
MNDAVPSECPVHTVVPVEQGSPTGVGVAPTPTALKDIKVVRGLPLVGTAVDLVRDPLAFLTRIAREHPGEIVGFRLGPVTVYLVTYPDHVQQLLQEQWRSCSKGGPFFKALRPLLGNGLATSDGAFWLRQRRLMQPLFNTERLSVLADSMVDVIDREVTFLVARGPRTVVDVEREMRSMTGRLILSTMFSQELDHSETDRLRDAIQIALEGTNLRMALYFLPERFPLPDERRFRAALATIDETTFRFVRARRAGGAPRDDLLSLLIGARDADTGEGMDDRHLRDELVTMFAAGYDTTAGVMAWLWYALDQNPEVNRRLRAEVASVLGDRRPRFEDLASLRYTKQVFQEVMRLYPSGWIFSRAADQEMIIGGHRIPVGASLLVSPFVSHRDPAFWPDPEAFDPERFTPERSAQRPRYAYYPLGGGPRQCIGNQFATMQAQLITAMMVQRLRPRLVPGHRVAPASGTTLKTRHGMKMTLDSVG